MIIAGKSIHKRQTVYMMKHFLYVQSWRQKKKNKRNEFLRTKTGPTDIDFHTPYTNLPAFFVCAFFIHEDMIYSLYHISFHEISYVVHLTHSHTSTDTFGKNGSKKQN